MDKLDLLTKLSAKQLDKGSTLAGAVAGAFIGLYSFGILDIQQAGPVIAICVALDGWLTNKKPAGKKNEE